MKRSFIFLLIFVAVLATMPSAFAQKKGSGVLSGVVLGPDDRPVPHASVTYQSSAGIAPHAVHADGTGHFTITKLHTDNYDLRASGMGVYSEWHKNVAVRSGQTKNVTLRLIYAKEIPKAYTKRKATPQ